jgi:hypothetical protein
MFKITTKLPLFVLSFFRVFVAKRGMFKGVLQPLMVSNVTINSRLPTSL